MSKTTLFDWEAARDQAMAQVEENANEVVKDFSARAAEFILRYLANNGATSGEDLTDACKAAGIRPHDDRAFGPVYFRLSRTHQIEKAGTCIRKRGHGTNGGTIWKLKGKPSC
jgi:hypothetical protein